MSKDPCFLVTGNVRLSYVHLTQPHASQQGAEPKYSVTLLIPKTDPATYQACMQAIEAAAQQGVAGSWNGVRPPNLPIPLHDGDGMKETGMPYGGECRGCWVMTASSKQKPQVWSIATGGEILNPSEIYSGMYARVSIRFFPYSTPQKRGVGCGLNNVLKIQDGEPLTARSTAAQDFADILQGIPSPAGTSTPPPAVDPLSAQPVPIMGI